MVTITGTSITQVIGGYSIDLTLPSGIDYYGWTDYQYLGTVSMYISPLFRTIGDKLNELFKPEDWEQRLYSLMMSLRQSGLPRRELQYLLNTDKIPLPYRANLRAIIINDNIYQNISWDANRAELDNYVAVLTNNMLYVSSEVAKLGIIVEYELEGSEEWWVNYLTTKLNLELALSSEFSLIDSIKFGSITIPLRITDYIKNLQKTIDTLEDGRP